MYITNNPVGKIVHVNKGQMPPETYIVSMALVSEGYDLSEVPQRKVDALFDEIMRLGHWGCLDHVQFTFYIECPKFVFDHFVRSSHAVINASSLRFSEAIPTAYVPPVIYTDVKRKELSGKPEAHPHSDLVKNFMSDKFDKDWDSYQRLLGMGVRKEQASRSLPTDFFCRFNLSLRTSDLLHMLNLRTHPDAQEETVEVANHLENLFSDTYPSIHKLWCKYSRGPINEYGTIQTP